MSMAAAAELAGQVALVTGAGRGLGRAIATRLAEAGAAVHLVDRDRSAIESAAATLANAGLAAFPHEADVADEPSLERLRAAVTRTGERVDILVNNAGGWRHARYNEITVEDWRWTFDTNVLSVLLCTRRFADLMIARRYGRIVNIASVDAYRAKPTLPHYAAAKAAVVSLTKSLAEELAPHQVLVNAVSPGGIATEAAKAQSWLAESIPKVPVRRAAEPEDIAEVVAFLASPRNRFMAGETVIASGGALMV
jgi:NAD(P)-dependent dehydrogenase (short-subunit alcohol dehydrogenase family)